MDNLMLKFPHLQEQIFQKLNDESLFKSRKSNTCSMQGMKVNLKLKTTQKCRSGAEKLRLELPALSSTSTCQECLELSTTIHHSTCHKASLTK